jgi:hypothetical protein
MSRVLDGERPIVAVGCYIGPPGKYGLRTRVMDLFGLTCEIMYGPVPGRNGARLM